MHLDLGDDPEGLRVALEAVAQPEPLPGQPVQHPLAEVAEGRVTEVVRTGRGLHHDMVETAEASGAGRGSSVLQQPDGDRPGHRGDLDRVGQPVVHHAAGRAGA